MLLILDRIEEGIAVLTDGSGKIYECPPSHLPEGAKEGSALEAKLTEDGEILILTLTINPEAGKNERRLRALFNRHSETK